MLVIIHDQDSPSVFLVAFHPDIFARRPTRRIGTKDLSKE